MYLLTNHVLFGTSSFPPFPGILKGTVGMNTIGLLGCLILPRTSFKEVPASRQLEYANTNSPSLDRDTRQLIGRFLGDFTGLSEAGWVASKAQSSMKRVVTRLVDKHRFKYNGIINQLSLDQRGYDLAFIGEVAHSLFADGTTTWGRIASLVAFGAVVSQYLKEKGRACCVETVAQEISTYLLSHQRTWLMEHNSWDGFVQFFQEADSERAVKNALLTFVGLASIAAALVRLFQ
ncbi:induced myeloid leukemia cell differentiation protein Mcl-1 homolog [Dunckerocampus dactyliophorus]|uniref:induced myeloid leukemia cell differentiation protein Mcl-1 homolog n=1 Tax=Dunckerocampus dactyliophorus TaxID=161453 RepID=UPI0024063025|nr:induced myeloid leukemia cell differentiation protein Mcl-1 homolog [Dunckerocampus dactyliophorus]